MKPIGARLIVLLLVLSGLSPALSQEKKVLSLEEAVGIALENNPGITVSDANIEISKAFVRNMQAPYYPDIYTRIIVPFVGRESGFFLDQMIWDFGRTSNKVKSGKAQLESAKYDRETTREDIELNTIVSYYGVLSQMHITEARGKKVAEAERRFERAEGFYKAGRVSQIEVTKEEVSLGNAKMELAAARNDLEIAEDSLMAAMGMEGEFNFELVDTTVYEKKDISLEDSIDRALETRPEIKSLKAQEASMKANLAATKKEFYPLLFGRTAYRFKGEGAETPGFIAGVGFQLPIFDGFSRFANVQDAKAKLMRSQAEMETAKVEIAAEVKQLRLDLDLAQQNIQITEKTRESAERSFLLAQERYRLERASELELAEAEALYSSSNAAYMQAIYNYNITAAKLERAVGGTDEADK
ncbi:MAG: TolC family protein [Thermodesulfobacteriota bacterium]